MISKEFQIKIFHAMTELINKKGAKNKMVSVFDIADYFKSEGNMSKILIEACLDVLIQHKYVRYYRNEKSYIYFGITQLGWTRWEMRVGQEQQQLTIDEKTLRQAEQHVATESVTIVAPVAPAKRKPGRPRKTA